MYQLTFKGIPVRFDKCLFPYDRASEVFLNGSVECCTELFESYKFVMNGKPVVVKNVYRYLTIDMGSVTEHDVYGDYWDSIDMIERYVVDVKHIGFIELKKFQWIHLRLEYPLDYSDRYTYDKYADQISRAVLKSSNSYIRGPRITSIENLTTRAVDTSEVPEEYELSD